MLSIFALDALNSAEAQAVWELLCKADREFVPSLSSRNSSTQKKLNNQETPAAELPTAYYEVIMKQKFLLGKNEAGEPVGFMTYINGYSCEELEGYNPSTYITTIVVEPDMRNRGMTTRFYEYLFKLLIEKNVACVTTRTWSTNNSHISILEKLGFCRTKVLINDRGENIHTFYYGLKL